MAGIGFELQRVLKRGGITGTFKAALAGIIIVAGPWLISIIGIAFLYQFSSSAVQEGGLLFTSAVVYSYAFSLFLFGGIHYIFTRYISDLIYIKEYGRALGALVLVMLSVGFLSGTSAAVTVLFLDLTGTSYPIIFKISAVVLFISINLIWLLMIFITLLKRYMIISLIYIAGMAVSVIAAYFLGHTYLLGGALAGFCLGQVFILLFLFILITSTIKISPPAREFNLLLKYFGKYKFLFLTGVFYTLGIWIDKIVLWFLKGDSVYGTFIHLFAEYDMPVYLANLTIIPGLVYFMIFSESNFYIMLKRMLLHLGTSNLSSVKKDKYSLLKTVRSSLREQALFQGVITIALLMIAPDIKKIFIGDTSTVWTLRITFTALFFNLMLLTTVTFLFYIEKYKEAFIAAFIFFSINLSVTLYGAAIDAGYYGFGYLTGCITGAMVATVFLVKGIKYFDRDIFSKF